MDVTCATFHSLTHKWENFFDGVVEAGDAFGVFMGNVGDELQH